MILSFKDLELFGSKRRPLKRSSIISGTPPALLPITGVPISIDSATTKPNVSS